MSTRRVHCVHARVHAFACSRFGEVLLFFENCIVNSRIYLYRPGSLTSNKMHKLYLIMILSHNFCNLQALKIHVRYWVSTRENLSSGCANNKGAHQPVHPRRLISAIVIRFLESIISKPASSEIPFFLKLASVAE